MLVLTRRPHETVRIVVPPSHVEQVIDVTCVEVRVNSVRMGFDAAREILFSRTELPPLPVKSAVSGEPNDELPIERSHSNAQ